VTNTNAVTADGGGIERGALERDLGAAVAQTLNDRADAAGIDRLDWTLTVDGGTALVHGSPAPGATDPAALCEAWAGLLAMEKYRYEDESHEPTWFISEGAWLIEVCQA
jgi:hypothetical protein